MTFLIVGGGPTGVELAGAIAELARFGMAKDFRRIDPAQARVILVQSAPRILPTFTEELSDRAARALQALGVELITGSRVTESMPRASWSAVGASRRGPCSGRPGWSPRRRRAGWGLRPTMRAGWWLDRTFGSSARRLSSPSATRRWQTPGRASRCPDWPPRPSRGASTSPASSPPRSPGASRRRPSPTATRAAWRPSGARPRWRISAGSSCPGALAWWLWGGVHLFFLVGVRNRVSVVWDWFWAYLTYRSGTRLITGTQETDGAVPAAQPRAAAQVRAV